MYAFTLLFIPLVVCGGAPLEDILEERVSAVENLLKPLSKGVKDISNEGRFEYKFDERQMSWADSEKQCEAWGGHLATIHCQVQNDYIASELKNRNMISGWIGLCDCAKEGSFRWVDNKAITGYTNWRSGEPSGGTRENCVEIIPGKKYNIKDWKKKWNDSICKRKNQFVCQREKATLEYKFDTRQMSWSDSDKECKKWGGRLATIWSQTQNAYFASELKKRNMASGWIGFNDRVKEGTFEWVGGAKLNCYTNWRNGEPSGGTRENCVELIPGKKYNIKDWKSTWNDSICTRKNQFICERRKPSRH